MTSPLTSHRDDGALGHALRRLAPGRLGPVAAALVGCVVLAVGLAVDGSRTAIGSLLGVCGFVVLGAFSAAGRGDGRLRWVVPPLLHTGEYATLIVLAWRAGMPPAAFALLAVVAFHHYDLVYLQGAVHHPRPVDLLAGGWEGRTLLLTFASLAGLIGAASVALALWVAILVVVSAALRVRGLLHDDSAARGHAP